MNSGRGSCDRECDWLVFRGVYERREVSVNPYLKIPSKQRPGLNDIGCEFFEWRGQWRLNVMARSHYHLRFRGSFGGGGVGDNPGCSPELTGAGFVGLVRVGLFVCL